MPTRGQLLGFCAIIFWSATVSAQSNLIATVRHAPLLNGTGRIEGSAQQLLGESVTLNGGFVLTGDLILPGTPTVITNGSPSFAGILVGTGSSTPTGYSVILNGGVSLQYLRTRSNAVSLPTVTPPPSPAGTRSVTITAPGQSIGDPATLRNLTLNGNVGQIAVPPGTYGNFIANGGSGFTLGEVGATNPSTYNLQNLTLNGSTKLDIVGPIILKAANGFTGNGMMGTTNQSSWLQLQLSSGGFTLNSSCTMHGSVVAPAGTVTINGGSYLFGSVQSDRLTVNSGGIIKGGSATVNQPPVANAQNVTTAEDTATSVTLTGTDPEGAPLTYTVLTQPTRGIVTGTAPNLTYTPGLNENGADSFTFKVNDGAQDSASATVSITITAVNDAPVAQAQSISTAEDMFVPVTLVGTDVEGSTLTYTVVTQPQHGILLNTAPNLIYEPDPNYYGPDSFTFRVNDGSLNSAAATVSITVHPLNDRPVADAQSLFTDEDTTLSVTLTGVDIDNDPLTYTVLTQPGHGTLSGTAPNLSYLPATNYNGTDSFTFEVSDGTTNSLPATISLTILPVNDRPIVYATNYTTLEDTATNVVITASDVEDTNLTFTVVTQPAHGTLTGTGDNLIYSPAANYHGSDSFTFKASDGLLDSETVTVSLTISPLNDNPVADAKTVTTDEDAGVSITLTGSDVDGDTLTFNVLTQPAHGTLSGTPPNLLYTPATNYHGSDSFTYEASDASTSSAPATVSITINSVNDVPVVDAGADQTNRQDQVTSLLAIISDDGDPVGSTLTFQWSGQGPGSVFFADRNATNTTVTFSTPGVYVLTATATDGLATNQDQVTITVTPPNTAPMVSAGQGQLVYLPNGATLNGAVQDDGIPAGATITTTWSLVSGPGSVTFGNASATNTTVTFSTAGNYTLRLTASDTELVNSAQVTFAVRNPAVNVAPVVNAGRDKTIGLTNVVTLCGSVSDDGLPQGAPLSIAWSVVSGPGTVTFDNASLTNSRATFSALGTYVLRLTASDTALSAFDDVSITVYPENNPPVVNAGADQTILVPDPALLSEDGSVSLTPQVELSVSLSSLARWNNAIGQPGLTGVPAGAGSTFVWRHGIALDGTNLYASGLFRLAGGELVKGVARWDGAQWFPLFDPRPSNPTNPASPPIGFIAWDHTEYTDSVLAWGGNVFSTGFLKDLNQNGVIDFSARWDGAGWNPWGVRLLQANQFFRGFATSSQYLYIVGNFAFQPVDGNLNTANPPLLPGVPLSYNITRWNGTNWTNFGSGIRDIRDSTATGRADPSDFYTNWYSYVFAVAEGKNGEVYAAGQFNMITPTGVASNIAKWNGTNWAPLGLGISGCSRFACSATVNALAIAPDGSLYAGGDFAVAGGVPANDVARWDGTNWHALGAGPSNGSDNEVITLAVHGSEVYVGGSFNNAGGFGSRSIARWNGLFWSPLGPGSTNGVLGQVLTLAVDDTGLYVGGDFSNAGGLSANEIAKWEFPKLPPTGADLAGSATDDGLPMDAGLSFLWTKVNGPGTVTFANATNAITTARFSAAGNYVLRLTASDSDLTGSDELTVEVIANAAPVVTANAPGTVGINESFALQGAVSDDGLPASASVVHAWSVISTPANAVVTIQNPAATNTSVRMDRTGVYLLRLTANDSHFSSYADVVVTVQSANLPPSPNLFTYTFAVTLPAAGYVQADPSDDGRPVGVTNILWSFVSGPAPVAFSNATAVGTPVYFTTPGSYVLRMSISDTELTATTERTITVSGPAQPPFTGNNAPSVNAGPDLTVVARRPFTLNGSASDDGLPAGSTLITSWSASNNVDRVYFDDARQPVTTAIINTPGTYILRLGATDTQFSLNDEVIVTVVAATNEPPLVSAGPDLEVTRPQAAQLFGAVSDDGLPLAAPLISTWSVVSGPGSVTLSPTSTTNAQPFSTATFNAPGLYVLRLTASDSVFTRTDDVTITVNEGTNAPPFVSAGPDRVVAMPNLLVLATIAADDGLPSGELQVTWSQISGPGNATFTTFNGTWLASFNTAGAYVLRLTADDGALAATDDVTVTVYNAPDAPLVAIISPLDAAIVTAPTVVTGTVQSVILQSWTLQYRLKPSEDEELNNPQSPALNWIALASGSTEVSSGPLGIFDPTLLLNGIYELQLTATDLVGRTSTTEPVTLVVDRNMKVGHFTLSFNDLTIPLAGIPIQVTRTYDSRDKRVGDFGVGWTLDVKNIRLQKNRNLGLGWEQTSTGGGFATYCLDPRKARTVTITFPDGRAHKFQVTTVPDCQFGAPITGPAVLYDPLANTRGSLVSLAEDFDEVLVSANLGPAELLEYNGNVYNPSLFQYTSDEGETFILHESGGLRSMKDRNGNQLTISTNGITWTNTVTGGPGLSVAFLRDDAGRITNILDAASNSMTYRYDTNGNLITFMDRVNLTNSFAYDDRHQLLTITDARGIQAVRNEYDAAGRLVVQIDAVGHTNRFTHDLNARREILTDRLGHVTTHWYDDNGNVIQTQDALGHLTQMAYDPNDNLLEQVDALGNTNRFTYDGRDNKLTETDPVGFTTRYTYDAFNRPTSITDKRGNVTTNVFDSRGNLTSMTDALGHSTTFSYDGAGNVLDQTDALGHRTENAYNQFGRITNSVIRDAQLGVLTTNRYAFDANGNQTNMTTRGTVNGAPETLVTAMVYDTKNRLVLTIHPDGSTNATIYNAIDKPAVEIDPLGRQTTHQYDDRGNRILTTYADGTSEQWHYDQKNRLVAMTDKASRVTGYFHDALSRRFATVFPDGAATTNYFDALGRVIATTDERGNSTWFGYDPNCGCGQRRTSVTNALGEVTRFDYDENGNQIAMIDALGRTNRYELDALNRRVAMVFPDGTRSVTAFDSVGRRIAQTDQSTNTTAFAYDARGLLLAVTNALGHVTRYEYDEQGRQVTQTDALNRATRYEYDLLGRRTVRRLPLNQVETYAYDSVGNMTVRTDFNGRTTGYAFDSLNRITQKTPDASFTAPPVTFSYNELGLRTNMTDASGVTAFRYDNRNRLIEKATPQGTLLYAYDAHGSVTNISSTTPDGVRLSYSHDALNRLATVVDPNAGTTSYGYDAVGNLSGFVLPNDVLNLYEYDSLNRLTNLTARRFLNTLASYAYTVNPSGHRVTATETLFRNPLNPVPYTINRLYRYDATYRLTNETINTPQLTTPATLNYAYDAVGNRVDLLSTLAEIPSASYGYDLNDRLTSDTYDNNGNTLTAPGFGMAQPDRYDFENRLIERTVAGKTVSIVYDGDGNRVRKTVTTATNTVTTLYLVDTMNLTGYAQVLEEHISLNSQPSTLNRVYALGLTLLSQDQLLNGVWTVRYHGQDGHGSTRYLTDALGDITDTYDYDAFGNLIATTGNTPNNFLFTSEQLDPDLGLYFLRARYQDTATGRFWTMDTFEGFGGDPFTLHKYLYAQSNPVNYSDPTGRFTINTTLVTFAIGGIVSTLVTASQPGFFDKSTPEILRDLGVSFVIGGSTSLLGNSVAAKLLLKGFGKIFASALAGASSAFVAQSLNEISDFVLNGKELTFQTIGCSVTRIGTATFAGLTLGGLLANARLASVGRPTTYHTTGTTVPLQLTSYRDVLNAPGAVGIASGGLIVNAVAYWFPFFGGCQ